MTIKDAASSKSAARKTYQAPEVVRVSLRPEEAVLGSCKMHGAAGPTTGHCSKMGVSCSAQGS